MIYLLFASCFIRPLGDQHKVLLHILNSAFDRIVVCGHDHKSFAVSGNPTKDLDRVGYRLCSTLLGHYPSSKGRRNLLSRKVRTTQATGPLQKQAQRTDGMILRRVYQCLMPIRASVFFLVMSPLFLSSRISLIICSKST